MNDYFQYVHNLKGVHQFEQFRPRTRDAIISLLLRQIDDPNTIQKTILKEEGKEVLDYLSEHLNFKDLYKSIILSVENSSYVEEVDFNNVQAIINLRKINNTQRPNKLFRAVNKLLPKGGIYIGRVQTYWDRKMDFLERFGVIAGHMVWVADFFINRVMPRLKILDRIYYAFNKAKLHSISQSEILGRLVYCGFDIVDYKIINGLTWFVARKKQVPLPDANPSYFPMIKLSRVGMHGRLLNVYKIRTMHPYSEYIQDYMVRTNGYDITGRPANDFRITCWGKGLRRFWIDELPQLINVLRGEMKLVGLRPLSIVRFNEFPEDLKAERINYKPGCIPPYIALNMPGDRESIIAERIYIDDLRRHPRTTDLRYFFMAVFNMLFNRIKCS
jgi:hypothetical protein